jgi:hypothetical protein
MRKSWTIIFFYIYYILQSYKISVFSILIEGAFIISFERYFIYLETDIIFYNKD